jgi:hypothetical protein
MSEQTAGAFVDVDAFLAEVQGQSPVIRLMGKDWNLAPSMPTMVRLRLARAAAADEVLTDLETVGLVRSLLGEDQTDDLLAAGVGQEGLDALLLAAMSAYRGLDGNDTLAAFAARINGTDTDTDTDADADADAEGKAPAPVTNTSS